MKLNKKRFLIMVAVIFALVFGFSFLKKNISFKNGFPMLKSKKTEVPKQNIEAPPTPVKAYKVARVSFRDSLPSLGTIKGFREFDMRFPVSGTVEYINFKEGEKITQGDIIASLDQKEALLKLEYAKVELDKQTKLFELGSILETKLKQSQLEYQSAKTELEKTNLVSPSDGFIGAIETDKGAFVTPQDKVARFVDIQDVFVEFGIIEKDIAKVREGQNVEVAVESYGDEIFKGQVDSISPIVEGRSRTLRVRSKLANVDEKIKPGMFGRVNLLVYEKEDALVIPSSSFKKKEDQYFVYLIHAEGGAGPDADAPESGDMLTGEGAPQDAAAPQVTETTVGTIEIRPIEISYATPDAIEIKEGLEEGDMVVVDVQQELQDKAKVEVTETQEGIF